VSVNVKKPEATDHVLLRLEGAQPRPPGQLLCALTLLEQPLTGLPLPPPLPTFLELPPPQSEKSLHPALKRRARLAVQREQPPLVEGKPENGLYLHPTPLATERELPPPERQLQTEKASQVTDHQIGQLECLSLRKIRRQTITYGADWTQAACCGSKVLNLGLQVSCSALRSS
jgi:hypothetical protein